MQSQEVWTWPDELEEGFHPAVAGEPKASHLHQVVSYLRTPSHTRGWQTEFPLLSSPTDELWYGERTAQLRPLDGLDPLFWEGILE